MSENIWVSLYYRRFMNGFSKIFRPLNALLVGSSMNKSKRKKDAFEWGKAHDTAFRTIIENQSNPPVLAYTDYRRPFNLLIDASTSGLGAVLYQEQTGIDHVIANASMSLKTSKKIPRP